MSQILVPILLICAASRSVGHIFTNTILNDYHLISVNYSRAQNVHVRYPMVISFGCSSLDIYETTDMFRPAVDW